MDFGTKFVVLSVGTLVFLHTTCSTTPVVGTTPQNAVHFPMLTHIDGKLVRLMDNCTNLDPFSCPGGYCCTKQYLTYPVGYSGTKIDYQLECRPYRKSGEFCYYNTPDNFCPCQTRCHTNGFYGSCL